MQQQRQTDNARRQGIAYHELHTQPAPLERTGTFVGPLEAQPQQTALAKRDTFVTPRAAPVVEILPPEALDVPDVRSPVQGLVRVDGDYVDRSKGFLWSITPVAVVTGVLSCVAGVALFSVPLLSFTVLLWFMTAFCVTWAIGYALHTFVSPDGVLFLHAWQTWRTVRAEQKHRHAAYWHSVGARRDGRQ